MRENLYYKVEEAAEYVTNGFEVEDLGKVAVIGGTGLGSLKELLDDCIEIPFSDIPYFPVSTAPSHEGKFISGLINGNRILMMAGRLHYYEGHEISDISIPIYVMKQVGIKRLITTNVSGGLQADMEVGDLVFVNDHINLMGVNPLRGKNDERLGIRFPDLTNLYNSSWNKKGIEIAENKGISAREGVYVGTAGPNLETSAEYNFLHMIGGDCVGMSGIPEMLTAAHAELDIMVIALISNVCYPTDQIVETNVDTVVKNAKESGPKLFRVVEEIINYFYKDLNREAE